jgi:O-antigen/teichoic acid export membrane protein
VTAETVRAPVPAAQDAVLTTAEHGWFVARRAAHGSLFLLVRQGVVTAVNLAGGITLARLLSPGEYGVYAVVVVLVAFGDSIGDAGLGASLVRQTRTPTNDEVAQVFTAQLVLGVVLGLLVWFAAPFVSHAYGSAYVTTGVLRWGAAAVVLLALQGVPSSLLDRELSFGRVAIVNTVEVLVFNGVAIGGAVGGLHANALPVALVAQTFVGVVMLWVLRPTTVGLTLHLGGMRERARFGIFYQASSFVSYVKDAISPLIVGILVGAVAVGYVEWAQTVATYSLVALSVMQRVYLPTFSRLREQTSQLRRAVEGSIRAGNAIVAPIAALSVVLAKPGIALVFGARWEPGLHVFYLLAFANVLVPTVAPLVALLNAQGRSGATFAMTLGWMVLTWVFGVPLIGVFGYLGYGIANVVVVLSNVGVIWWVRRTFPFGLPGLVAIWLRALAVGAVILGALQLHAADSLVWLGAYACAGAVAYLLIELLTDRDTVRLTKALFAKRAA